MDYSFTATDDDVGRTADRPEIGVITGSAGPESRPAVKLSLTGDDADRLRVG